MLLSTGEIIAIVIGSAILIVGILLIILGFGVMRKLSQLAQHTSKSEPVQNSPTTGYLNAAFW